MQGSFRTILVPVDFSRNTELAIQKAIQLSGENTTLHLLHVKNPFAARLMISRLRSIMQLNGGNAPLHLDHRLEQLKISIQAQHRVRVAAWVHVNDSVQEAIEEKARLLQPDLIIIAKRRRARLPLLNRILPALISNRTNIPVLVFKPGAMQAQARTILVSVNSCFQEHKQKVIAALCKKYRLTIHLVSFSEKGNLPESFSASALLKMYQWIKSNIRCPVEYSLLHGSNKAKLALEHARKIGADILILTPVEETRVDWMNRHISDILPPDSCMQVLSVN